ncbi:MAG: hypothetical protein SNJ71_06475 [Bacteroidales bacterium]
MIRNKHTIFGIIIIFFSFSDVYSQHYPELYGASHFTEKSSGPLYILQPTVISEATFLLKQRTGMFSDIRSSRLKVAIPWFNSTFLGTVNTENEGEYINKGSFYGAYSVRIPIRKNWSLHTGIGFGAVYMAFVSNSMAQAGNDTRFDSNIGLGVTNKQFIFLISAEQLTKPTPVPYKIGQEFGRLINCFSEYKVDLDSNFTCQVMTTFSLFENQKNYYALGSSIERKKVLGFGTQFSTWGDLMFCLWFDMIRLQSFTLQFTSAYQVRTNIVKLSVPIHTFQFIITGKVKKKSNIVYDKL